MKNGIIITLLVILMGCQQNEPNYAHIILEEQGDRYAPQLDILVQANTLSIQIKLDGTSVYDTSHILTPEETNQLYQELKENGVKIYNHETPEWKTRNTTIFKDSQLLKASQLAIKLNAYDGQYHTVYRSYVEAADEASEESNYTDAQILNEAELLDSLKAD
jgi:hypothetical protein